MKLSDRAELLALAERLTALAEERSPADERSELDQLLAAAQREISRRKSRRNFALDSELGEAGWAILLDLFIMEAHGRRVSITSAVIASSTPTTTGLRYVSVLTDHGLVARDQDPLDKRRVYLKLLPKGKSLVKEAMRRWIDIDNISRDNANPRRLGKAQYSNGNNDEYVMGFATYEEHRKNILHT